VTGVQTCALPISGLCFEMFEAVYEMFLEEVAEQ
jgi:hypothetical protein